METKNKFGKNIIASFLLMSLLLPTVFHFVSVFEYHHHVVCSEQQVHVHKFIVDCEICSFHFTPLNYNLARYKPFEVLFISETTQENFTSLLFHSFTITNIKLRGPPALA
tara:strand:- start:1205 stop:1534 length:330 start_codon:yes stop_codon:yes gene_type:complete